MAITGYADVTICDLSNTVVEQLTVQASDFTYEDDAKHSDGDGGYIYKYLHVAYLHPYEIEIRFIHTESGSEILNYQWVFEAHGNYRAICNKDALSVEPRTNGYDQDDFS